MPLQMSESSLVALIESMEADCYGESDGTLSRERAEALDRYNGLLLGNEVTGRSAAISTDLRDTVEAVLPQLLRIFFVRRRGGAVRSARPGGRRPGAARDGLLQFRADATQQCVCAVFDVVSRCAPAEEWLRQSVVGDAL